MHRRVSGLGELPIQFSLDQLNDFDQVRFYPRVADIQDIGATFDLRYQQILKRDRCQQFTVPLAPVKAQLGERGGDFRLPRAMLHGGGYLSHVGVGDQTINDVLAGLHS